jgi:hypothetical protein
MITSIIKKLEAYKKNLTMIYLLSRFDKAKAIKPINPGYYEKEI